MRPKTRLLALTVTLLVSVVGSVRPVAAAPPEDVVLTWNQIALDAFVAANVKPPAANRLGAIVQSAVFDAVNGIEKRYTPIHVAATGPDDASPQAAAASAAHEVLVKLFPDQAATLDAELSASLHDTADPGVSWGRTVADQIFAWRATDGFNTKPGYVFRTDPGQWRPTPGGPGGTPPPPPAFRSLAITTPFALNSPGQFRPGGPPALTSARYAQDLAEVTEIGAANSPTRTAYQTQTAIFWGVGDSPVGLWDRVADELASENHFNVMRSARLLALLNMSIADAVIAVFEAKNFYNSWRPVTAINLTSDPTWTPLLVNPYFQEYPSAHSGTSSAAGAILASVFGDNTTFTATSLGPPRLQRTYTSFSSAVAEVGDARVYAGIHFRSACDDAITMGIQIAAYVNSHMVLPAGD